MGVAPGGAIQKQQQAALPVAAATAGAHVATFKPAAEADADCGYLMGGPSFDDGEGGDSPAATGGSGLGMKRVLGASESDDEGGGAKEA